MKLTGLPCPLFDINKKGSDNSRGKLYNAIAVLWASNQNKSFITFTLPSLANGIYQNSFDCPDTGDIAIGKAFSKTLEAWKQREKRKGSGLFSYVWVAEAQQKRSEKFGGPGDLHFHLIVNRKFKNDYKGANGKFNFVDTEKRETFDWIQLNWCKQIKAYSNNCVHVDPLPDFANSIPAYMSKYFGKGQCRPLVGRKFQATQDLSKFKPIQLTQFPEGITLIREKQYITPEGFEINTSYFNTREVLELYGGHMSDTLNQRPKQGNGKSLTDHARAMDRNCARMVWG